MTASLTTIARRLLFVHETEGPNAGKWVRMLQQFGGGRTGDSWCMYFVYFVVALAYNQLPPLPRTGSCQEVLEHCRAKGWIMSSPAVDDLVFFVNDAGLAHHVGIVTALNPLTSIAGNTSPDGKSSNGTGVFEHPINAGVFARLPKE